MALITKSPLRPHLTASSVLEEMHSVVAQTASHLRRTNPKSDAYAAAESANRLLAEMLANPNPDDPKVYQAPLKGAVRVDCNDPLAGRGLRDACWSVGKRFHKQIEPATTEEIRRDKSFSPLG